MMSQPGGCSNQAEVRAAALSLPEAHPREHGRPDLRVRRPIVATLRSDGLSVNLKTTAIGLDLLVRSDPAAYSDLYGGRWVGIDLGRVPAEGLRDLVVQAYCRVAPRRLAAAPRSGRQ